MSVAGLCGVFIPGWVGAGKWQSLKQENKIYYEQQQKPHSCICRVDSRTEDLTVEDDILGLCDQNFI